MVSSRNVGVRRSCYPSGPWVDAAGNPAKSPNPPEPPIPKETNPPKADRAEIYTFIKAEEHGNYLIVQINYSNCKNYEGNKILVYKNMNLLQLVNNRSMIEPHFVKGNENLIARFIPTEEGWALARKLVR